MTGIFRCLQLSMIAGNSSSETTNGMILSVVSADGIPAAGARMRLRPCDYVTKLPALAKSAVLDTDALTDAHGICKINGIAPGAYRIEVSRGDSAVLFACSLAVRDTLYLGPDTLRPCATVHGTVDTTGMSGTPLFVQVIGLERLVAVDKAGSFTLSDLPAGLFSLRIVTADNAGTNVVRTDQVSAVAGASTTVTMQGWNYSKRLYFNTTASGAGVTGTVTGFPVLIRLTGTSFTFTQAAADGRDIRFTKPDNTPLAYEIERWDSVAQSAEIWVRMDTIRGNDRSQFILMLWGNPDAPAASKGAVVFDTAAGFQGVWHLNEAGGALVKDATGNNFDGTPSDTAPLQATGAIGLAREFNGVSNYIQMKGTAGGKLNFSENDSYTVSAWVYADTIDYRYHMVVGKGNRQYYLKLKDYNSEVSMRWEFVEYHNNNGWDITDAPAVQKAWIYLTGKRDGNRQYFYVNGALVDSSIELHANTATRNSGEDVTIGRYLEKPVFYTWEGYAAFAGKIDEVRIASVAHSGDWVKLCFANQNMLRDALVEFR